MAPITQPKRKLIAKIHVQTDNNSSAKLRIFCFGFLHQNNLPCALRLRFYYAAAERQRQLHRHTGLRPPIRKEKHQSGGGSLRLHIMGCCARHQRQLYQDGPHTSGLPLPPADSGGSGAARAAHSGCQAHASRVDLFLRVQLWVRSTDTGSLQLQSSSLQSACWSPAAPPGLHQGRIPWRQQRLL